MRENIYRVQKYRRKIATLFEEDIVSPGCNNFYALNYLLQIFELIKNALKFHS